MDRYLEIARELKKDIEHEGDGDTNCKYCIWNGSQRLGKKTEEISEEESRPSKLQHGWDWPEYWEKSWRPEETCCHSGSSERSPASACVKNLLE